MRDYLWFAQVLVDVDLTPQSYSGRGMYGKTCLGFVVERGCSPLRAFGTILLNLDEVGDLLTMLGELMEQAHEDSMGLGTIVYFPKIKWDDAYEDPHNASEEEEDEDEPEDSDKRSENLLERTCEDPMDAWEKDEQAQAQALQDEREQVDMAPKG